MLKKIIFKPIFIISIILSVFYAIFYNLTFYSINILTNLFNVNSKYELLYLFLKDFLYVFMFFIAFIIIANIRTFCVGFSKIKFQEFLKNQMLKKIDSLSYEELKKSDKSTYISWFIVDINDITSSSFSKIFTLVFNISMYISAIYLLAKNNIILAILTAFLSIVSVLAIILTSNILNNITTEKTKQFEKYTRKAKDILSQYHIFILNNKEDIFKEKINKANIELEKVVFRFNMKISIIKIIQVIFMITPYLILFLLLLIFFKNNFIIVFAISPIIANVFESLGSIIESIFTLKVGFVIFSKYNINLRKKVEKIVSNINFNKILLSNVDFSYDGSKNILENINIDFTYPNHYYITGQSGSGKTTLVKLLQGLYSVNNGKILIDDINIDNIDLKFIRENIAYLSQEIHIFNASIRDNICLWKSYPEEKINEVIKNCNLEEFINSSENGLDTIIEENGKNISGGQKQRIGLARAMIRKVKYLIIDEGTSQLDLKNAKEIEDLLLNRKDISCIIISHHVNNKDNNVINYKIGN